ncbi:hypothetical protein M5D96_000426, partial [Drosophila gunungcola]
MQCIFRRSAVTVSICLLTKVGWQFDPDMESAMKSISPHSASTTNRTVYLMKVQSNCVVCLPPVTKF